MLLGEQDRTRWDRALIEEGQAIVRRYRRHSPPGQYLLQAAINAVHAEAATVVRVSDGEVLTTDGPFAEAKEHLGGFYILEADDLDAALAWASKTTEAVSKPIEVRPFRHVSEA